MSKKNKITDEWNGLNVLSNNASTVGGYDLNLLSSNDSSNLVLEGINQNKFDIVFLFGQDNLNFKKKNEFVIYIGTHGDNGAEMADIILPGAAYTEQNGHYTNLEGKIQKSFRASYPPGEAKEDYEIINNISQLIKRKKLFKNKNELVEAFMKYLNLQNKNYVNKVEKSNTFIDEQVTIDKIDYYYSNVIARASYTMAECRNKKNKMKKTGTEG